MSVTETVAPAAVLPAPYPAYDPWRRVEAVIAILVALAVGSATDIYLLVEFGWLVALLGAWLSGALAGGAGLAAQFLTRSLRRTVHA